MRQKPPSHRRRAAPGPPDAGAPTLADLVLDHALNLAHSPAVDSDEAVAELVGLARGDAWTLEQVRVRCEALLAEQRPGDHAIIRAFHLLGTAAETAESAAPGASPRAT